MEDEDTELPELPDVGAPGKLEAGKGKQGGEERRCIG